MNGAESLVHTLLKSGVDTCFTNPGTSEMHFVAALDRVAGGAAAVGGEQVAHVHVRDFALMRGERAPGRAFSQL